MPDQDPAGKPGCDFMGVNHYARGVVGFFLNPTNKGPKGIADMGCEPPPPLPRPLTKEAQCCPVRSTNGIVTGTCMRMSSPQLMGSKWHFSVSVVLCNGGACRVHAGAGAYLLQ